MATTGDRFEIVVTRGGHIFYVNDKGVAGIYSHPTVNGDYMYVTEYFLSDGGIYKLTKVANEMSSNVEVIDRSLGEGKSYRNVKMGSFK